MKKIIALVFYFIISQGIGIKARSQGITYTLKQCIDIAVGNNIDVKNSGFKTHTNEVNLRQSKASSFPTLSANINHGLAYGRSIDPTSNSYIDQQILTAQYSLSSGIILWNGGTIQNNIKQNQLQYEAGRSEEQQAKDDLTINVILAYLQILNNKDQVALAIQQKASTKKQVEQLTVLNTKGAAPPATFLEQKGQLASDELNIISARNLLEISKLILSGLMNIAYSPVFRAGTPKFILTA